MSSGAFCLAFEEEPVDDRSARPSGPLWGLGLNAWPLTPEKRALPGVQGPRTWGLELRGNYP